jgi:hypothetical protein
MQYAYSRCYMHVVLFTLSKIKMVFDNTHTVHLTSTLNATWPVSGTLEC